MGEARLEVAVVVDLAVDGEELRAGLARAGRRRGERLRAVLDVDDGEPLVGEHGAVGGDDAAPVGPAVAQPAGEADGELAQLAEVLLGLEDGDDAAHAWSPQFSPRERLPSRAKNEKARNLEGCGPWRHWRL